MNLGLWLFLGLVCGVAYRWVHQVVGVGFIAVLVAVVFAGLSALAFAIERVARPDDHETKPEA